MVHHDSIAYLFDQWFIISLIWFQILRKVIAGSAAGRGLVIQDINATEATCLEVIQSYSNYSKLVPHVKSVTEYNRTELERVRCK